MVNFRPRAPLVPRQPGTLTDVADDELRRGLESIQGSDIANGRLTDTVTLSYMGQTQSIQHKLGRQPLGCFVAWYSGMWPEFRITAMDAKRITIVSQEKVDFTDRFVTYLGGAVQTQPVNPLVTVAAVDVVGSPGLYRWTFSVNATTVLSARAETNTANASYEVRYTTSAAGPPPTVDMTHVVGAVPTIMALDICLFHITLTGSAPKFKLWVF